MLSIEEIDELRHKLATSFEVNIRPRRIKVLKINSSYHWQPPLYIEVGKRCANLAQNSPPEEVIAIFEATTFMVCTPGHGYPDGLPYLFAKEDAHLVVEMD